MAIEELRPDETLAAGAWTAEPSGTLHGVTSDDNNSTWAEMATGSLGSSDIMGLGVTTYSLASDERVRRYRARVRRETSADQFLTLNWRARVTGESVSFTSSAVNMIATSTGPWTDPWTSDGLMSQSRIDNLRFEAMVTPSDTGVDMRVVEGWIDLDVRARPSLANVRVSDVAGGAGMAVITTTQRPWIVMDRTYGYAGMDPESMTREMALYRQSDTLNPRFQEGGPFDPGVIEEFAIEHQVASVSAPVIGVENTRQVTVSLNNDTYAWIVRQGAAGFPDSPWWGLGGSFVFEIDFVAPDPPDITCTVAGQIVELDITHTPSTGTPWDNPTETIVEIQRQINGGPWRSLLAPGNEEILAESDTLETQDRFVPRSSCVEDCDGNERVNDIRYRARLSGIVSTEPVVTEWAECPDPGTLTVCTDRQAWLRHPTNPELDMVVCQNPDAWTRERVFEELRPIRGGHPAVLSSLPGGRDRTISVVTDNTTDLNQLEELLADTLLVWFAPDDLHLTEQWLAVGEVSATATAPFQNRGQSWDIEIATIEVDPPPAPEVGG